MSAVHAIQRITLVIFWMLIFIPHAFVGSFFKKSKEARRYQTKLISLYARRILDSLGYHVDDENGIWPETAFIVANHLSYVDILCIAAQSPCVFVTSTEMRDTPFLGIICRLGGCIFVDRKRHFVARSELREIRETLSAGFRVVVFPEATSSDGSGLLPFKRGLFRAAQQARVPVMSLCLNYDEFLHEEPLEESLSRICYFGDDEFAPHLFSLARSAPLRAKLSLAWLSDLETAGDLREHVAYCRERIEALFSAMPQRAMPKQRYSSRESRAMQEPIFS